MSNLLTVNKLIELLQTYEKMGHGDNFVVFIAPVSLSRSLYGIRQAEIVSSYNLQTEDDILHLGPKVIELKE